MSLGEALTAAGYAVGALVLWWAARRKGLVTEGMGTLALVAFVSGVVGAKLTQLVAQGWPFRVPVEAALDPRSGGRALLGGLIFGWIGVEIAKRRLGIRRSTGDYFALALPAGEAVGRIGCYFNGCCYGTTCDAPWAVFQHGALRHPVQLYSAATAAALFVALLLLRPRVRREGDLFRLYLIGFGASRFALEFFRHHDGLVLGLSAMQWFCLELIAFASFTLVRRKPPVEAAG